MRCVIAHRQHDNTVAEKIYGRKTAAERGLFISQVRISALMNLNLQILKYAGKNIDIKTVLPGFHHIPDHRH